jgi:hypothetical protein
MGVLLFPFMRLLCGAQNPSFSGHNALAAALLPNKRGELFRMKMMFAACLVLGALSTSAGAVDMAELAPCKPAAARLCDRSAGMTWSNLLQCGATLAAQSWRVSNSCREVLRKYGQL